ncbi:MAG: HAD family hydrolase [Cyanobacteria bacterium K_DeepCast_35m_m2_023]|nr:HAD family hydrolase [Cyanobacteria bacterium K_DeepCast_35m_m2_023]
MASHLIALDRPPESPAAGWSVASDLPGRVRIRCEGLAQSLWLRQHCRLVLTSCHWLIHFRINGIAGSVCLEYPLHRRRELIAVLEEALTLANQQWQLAGADPVFLARRSVQRTTLHGAACFALLMLEVPLALGPWGMGLLATALLWPQLKELVHCLRHREISAETLELMFSSVLISQGLAGEAVIDLGFNDVTEVAQSAVAAEEADLDANHLLQRLGADIILSVQTADGQFKRQHLRSIEPKAIVLIKTREHCFLTGTICEGEAIVVNRLFNGDWRPTRLTVGDTLAAGGLVISGEAKIKVSMGFEAESSYALLREHFDNQAQDQTVLETWRDRYKSVMPPLLMAAGGSFLLAGSPERAISALQFSPVKDWDNSSVASRLTAVANFRLHNIQVRNPDALDSLSKIKHLVISRSCLNRLSGIRVKESIETKTDLPHGTLIQLLAGIQRWVCGTDGTPIWSDQLEHVSNPIAVESVVIQELKAGWQVTTKDGRQWLVCQPSQDQQPGIRHHLDPLAVSLNGTPVGMVDLICEPDEHWIHACEQLREIGIELHLVSSDERERIIELSEKLGIHASNRHGSCTASERLDLVRQLQEKGERVAFIGYVISDLPALSQADVSIGMNSDDDSRYTANICDLTLPANALWLPKLIRICRRLNNKRYQNFALLGGSQLLTSVATAAGLIMPLQTILLADIPLLIAEINNLLALSDHPRMATQQPTVLQPID